MVRVLAVNNYPAPERFERLRKCFEENGARVTAIDWRDASSAKFDSFDGVTLSGSPDYLSSARTLKKYSKEMEAIRETEAPLLGVCFGHQMIAAAFGAPVLKDSRHIMGFVKTRPLTDDPLFRGLPKPMMLLESRHEVVGSVPEGFDLIASSSATKIAGIKHRRLTIYGVQFHPERYTVEHPGGGAIVGNFVGLLG